MLIFNKSLIRKYNFPINYTYISRAIFDFALLFAEYANGGFTKE